MLKAKFLSLLPSADRSQIKGLIIPLSATGANLLPLVARGPEAALVGPGKSRYRPFL